MVSQPPLKNPALLPAAVLIAPVVWLVLYFILQPDIDALWPVHHPDVFLWSVVFFPVVEEIIFRGLVQEFIRDFFSEKYLGLLSIANLVTSLLFAGLHVILQPSAWAVLVFFPSLVFGLFKDRTGKLTIPIILHAFYNFGFLWVFSSAV